MTKRKFSSEEEFTLRANKMLRIMETDDNVDMDVDLANESMSDEHKSSSNRKFDYTLNKKNAQKKLIFR